jgi:hypothetical protein
VGGVVAAINSAVREDGKPVHQDPYTAGWVMTIHAGDLRRDLKRLLIGAETEEFITGELERLHQAVEEVSGPLAVDGGHLGEDLFGNMPELGWERLSRMFLHCKCE